MTLKVVRCTTLIVCVGLRPWAPNRCNSYPFRTSRQSPCNQWVGCPLCSVLRIYEGMGLRTCARFVGLVPCCDHVGVGYRAQVPEKPKKHNITSLPLFGNFWTLSHLAVCLSLLVSRRYSTYGFSFVIKQDCIIPFE